MRRWLDERVAEIRQQLTPGDEGSLWLLLFDDPPAEPLAVAVIDGAMGCLDRRMTDNLAMIICRVPAPAVLLAVPRAAGSPRAGDLRLWRDLGTLLDGRPTRLLDLVVVGGRRTWSARAPAARRQLE